MTPKPTPGDLALLNLYCQGVAYDAYDVRPRLRALLDAYEARTAPAAESLIALVESWRARAERLEKAGVRPYTGCCFREGATRIETCADELQELLDAHRALETP